MIKAKISVQMTKKEITMEKKNNKKINNLLTIFISLLIIIIFLCDIELLNNKNEAIILLHFL